MDKFKKVMKGLECCTNSDMSICLDKCPYHTDGCSGGIKMMRDALTLLKSQEPKVLTLDEAKAYVENEKDYYSQKPPIYIEYYQPKDYWVRWLTVELLRGWLSDDRITDYNKANPMGYRFWTYYPTDKQRKEVEWE